MAKADGGIGGDATLARDDFIDAADGQAGGKGDGALCKFALIEHKFFQDDAGVNLWPWRGAFDGGLGLHGLAGGDFERGRRAGLAFQASLSPCGTIDMKSSRLLVANGAVARIATAPMQQSA